MIPFGELANKPAFPHLAAEYHDSQGPGSDTEWYCLWIRCTTVEPAVRLEHHPLEMKLRRTVSIGVLLKETYKELQTPEKYCEKCNGNPRYPEQRDKAGTAEYNRRKRDGQLDVQRRLQVDYLYGNTYFQSLVCEKFNPRDRTIHVTLRTGKEHV
jgi:hypothetical protein